MPSYFLDSPALVKGYCTEVGAQRLNQLLRGPDALIVAQLAHLEVSSAIVRRGASLPTSIQEIQRSLNELDREMATSLDVIHMDDALFAIALRMARTHPLRAADSIQWAAGLVARTRRPTEEVILVSADLELQ